jgi:17-hydroxy-3-oxo-4-pregnene-20-carboxyl-CoA lyase
MIGGHAAITGIGCTAFTKNSGKSELSLALECSSAALADSGLEAADIDGMVTFAMDDTPEIAVAAGLRVPELSYYARTPYGGGGTCAVLMYAAMAVVTGAARNVLCYRAFNERSGHRFGRGYKSSAATEMATLGWYRPHGLVAPASKVAIVARRYMHEYGATSADFGQVTVAARHHAATNPSAWFYQRPITIEDHQASPWIAEPLRLLDCCQESDGGVAFIVSDLERARDLRQAPAVIRGAAQGFTEGQESTTSYYRTVITEFPEVRAIAGRLWKQSGVGPLDISAAMLYDHFTPYVLMQMEAFGFCGVGEGRHFVADGNIRVGGGMPVNPHGGQLGEGYVHGMNGVVEAVRQIRGSAVNQVANAEHVLISSGTGLPTSAAILSRDF